VCRSGRVRSELLRSGCLRPDVCGSRSELLRSFDLLRQQLWWLRLQVSQAQLPELVLGCGPQDEEEPLLRRWLWWWLRPDVRCSGRVRSDVRRPELRRSGLVLPLSDG